MGMPPRLPSGERILAGRVAVPGDHLSCDDSIPTSPLAACPLRPPRVPKVVEQDLNIEGARAFMEPSSESVYLLADLGGDPKSGVARRLPTRSANRREAQMKYHQRNVSCMGECPRMTAEMPTPTAAVEPGRAGLRVSFAPCSPRSGVSHPAHTPSP